MGFCSSFGLCGECSTIVGTLVQKFEKHSMTHWAPWSTNCVPFLSVSSCLIQIQPPRESARNFGSSLYPPICPSILAKKQAKKGSLKLSERAVSGETRQLWVWILSLINCTITSLSLSFLNFKLRIQIPNSWVVVGTKCDSRRECVLYAPRYYTNYSYQMIIKWLLWLAQATEWWKVEMFYPI